MARKCCIWWTTPSSRATGADLLALATGLTTLKCEPGGMALDFVRSQVDGAPMSDPRPDGLAPKSHKAGGRQNGLNNEVVDLLNRAVADANGTIYAFGSAYADADEVQGIHDIHMNQGNPPHNHAGDNGVWQDGAILMNLPAMQTLAGRLHACISNPGVGIPTTSMAA